MKFGAKFKIACVKSLFGRIKFLFRGTHNDAITNFNQWDHTQYKVGDRIGQLIIMPYPKVQMVEVDELSETERGTGGYGSTGR